MSLGAKEKKAVTPQKFKMTKKLSHPLEIVVEADFRNKFGRGMCIRVGYGGAL